MFAGGDLYVEYGKAIRYVDATLKVKLFLLGGYYFQTDIQRGYLHKP